ncbi:MAG: hypothetical protein ACTSXX_02435 [Candidatus Baldrarchaeia archaeon]
MLRRRVLASLIIMVGLLIMAVGAFIDMLGFITIPVRVFAIIPPEGGEAGGYLPVSFITLPIGIVLIMYGIVLWARRA